jgi:hypothetical protein
LGDQLLRGFELADDLLGCMPGAFHGRVPGPVLPDENSHSPWTNRRGPRHWQWVMVTAVVTVFIQGLSRATAAAIELLGSTFGGIVVSDRFSAYSHQPLNQRQLCWAHLIRDLTAIAECPEASAEFGAELLGLQQQVFDHWHRYKGGTIDWTALQQGCRPIPQAFEVALQRVVELGCQRGERTPWAKTVRTAQQILQLADGLWAFMEMEGIEPTNNAAERDLRQSVIQRKIRSWRPFPPGGNVPQPTAHRHDHPQATGPRCLANPRACLDCPSPWRGDAVTTARSLNQQHRALLLDRSAMSFQTWSPATGSPDS